MAIEKGVGGPLIGHKMHETAALKIQIRMMMAIDYEA